MSKAPVKIEVMGELREKAEAILYGAIIAGDALNHVAGQMGERFVTYDTPSGVRIKQRTDELSLSLETSELCPDSVESQTIVFGTAKDALPTVLVKSYDGEQDHHRVVPESDHSSYAVLFAQLLVDAEVSRAHI